MNNLLSYCGFVDARISASEKDIPAPQIELNPLINYFGKDGNQSELREACNRNDSLLEDLGETPTNFSLSKEATPTSGKMKIPTVFPHICSFCP